MAILIFTSLLGFKKSIDRPHRKPPITIKIIGLNPLITSTEPTKNHCQEIKKANGTAQPHQLSAFFL